MYLLKDKKAVLKFSFLILGLIAIAAIIVYAGGVFAATHTSTVDVTPHIVPNASSVDFTADVEWTSGDPIHEFRVYEPIEFKDLNCDSVSGWYDPFYAHTTIDGIEYYFCQWIAQTGSELDSGNPEEDFTFSLNTAETECCRDLFVETRDDHGVYVFHNPQVCVDTSAPTTEKTFDGPYKIDKATGREWIDGVTKVVLEAEDPEPHPSGVDKIWYIDEYLDCGGDGQCEQPELCVPEHTPDDGGWIEYTNPIIKEKECCHKLEFYSVDKVGNVESVKANCFYVDKTPPKVEKVVNEPKVEELDLEMLNDGKAYWVTSESYSGDASAKLVIPDDPARTDFAGVDSFFDVFVELDDVTSLSYYRKVTQADPTTSPAGYDGWGPIVILGIDANGDGVFEAQPLEWEETLSAGSVDPNFLGDDSFIQCEAVTGLSGTDSNFVNVDAYNNFKCYTPNVAGNDWTAYNLLSDYQTNPIGRIEPTDKVAMVKVELGGNPPTQDNEIAYVDNVELNGVVIIDEPVGFTWVTSETDITFTCTDQGPHPSEDEELCFKVSFDEPHYPTYLTEDYCHEYDGTMEDGYCCIDAHNTFEFNFNEDEDSFHDLEYFCRDAVEKKSETFLQYYKVDDTPPKIMKDMFGSYLGDCPSGEDIHHGDCYVADDRTSGVIITVEDPDPTGNQCNVNDVLCDYILVWEDQTVESGQFGEEGKEIIFEYDSTHMLEIDCKDALGNEMVKDNEEFLVDSTPPVTTKTYGEPYYECDPNIQECEGIGIYDEHMYPHWINSSTQITLNATDAKVGVDKTYWRYAVIDNYWCTRPATGCIHYDGTIGMDFQEYNGSFTLPQESCHIIEYYSIDKLGNVELVENVESQYKRQCVFVDNTAPIIWKEHDEGMIEDYDDILGEFHWMTQDMEIDLYCEDREDHPVDHVSLWYRTWDDISETWSGWVDPNGQIAHKTITFGEDSVHKLQYYCEDALGNSNGTREDPYEQIYKVDTTAPTITKILNEPYSGECPPRPNTKDICFVDTATTIDLEVEDGGEICHVDGVECQWRYKVAGMEWSDWNMSFPMMFSEECQHTLQLECWDALGNKWTDEEYFYVDKTPPTTTKDYSLPFYSDGTSDWITSDTEITFTVEDTGPHKSGIKETYYRISLLDDDAYCESEQACEGASAPIDSFFDVFTELSLVKIGEQSCHLIEYYSVDNVDKTETVNKQCVFVDNTPPTPLKEVGEPKTKWDGQDSDFYPWIEDYCWNGLGDQIECWKVTLDTEISMTCEDPTPHPVDNEIICFNVELDGDDWTESYCTQYNGDYNETGDGYCCLDYTVENFIFLETSEHNLKFYCVDALENKGPVDEEKFKVEGNDFEIQINKKWNLISVPVVLLNPDITEIIPDSMGDIIESVWAYDAELGEWYVYTPDGNDFNDNLHELIPGWGYWVLAKNETKIVIGGSLLSPGRTPPSRNLVPGWNLIGYYGIKDENGINVQEYDGPDLNGDGQETVCALGTLCGPLWFEEWGSVVTYWQPESNPWVELGRYDYMNPGAGYWVFMRDNGEYSKATGCCSFLGP